MPNLAHFYRIFLENLAYQPIYIQFVCYLDFQKLKKDSKNLFSNCHKVNFRKKTFFFVTLQSMNVPNFMSKAFSYQNLYKERGG